jgi:DNA-binding NarL/FixJ family response regulator
VVIVDPLPVFRAGAAAALTNHGMVVLGEAAQVTEGVDLVRQRHARVLVLSDVTVGEAVDAASALSSCSVVVLLAQASRPELVEMLNAGVSGLALRSLTPEDLVATVEAVADGGRSVETVFVQLLAGFSSPGLDGAGPPEAWGNALLTAKERLVLTQLARGASNQQIAEALYVTPATVKTHLAHIYSKLGAAGRHEALSRALELGMLR